MMWESTQFLFGELTVTGGMECSSVVEQRPYGCVPQVRFLSFRFRIGGGIGKLYCGREVETHSLDDLNASSLIGTNPIPTDGTTRR